MQDMKKPFPLLTSLCLSFMLLALGGCGEKPSKLPWRSVASQEARLTIDFPCEPQMARTKVDFGLSQGSVAVNMMGCDAVDSTFVLSHWLLDDAAQADDTLAMWQSKVLTLPKAVDGKGSKSGAAFIPQGALPLGRSIRATVEGEGPSGWTITLHAVWFAREEAGGKVRLFHAAIFAPKARHEDADRFFHSAVLQE